MPKGGHPRVSVAPDSLATRKRKGARARKQHREKGVAGRIAGASPPPGLDRVEATFWRYYAPLLLEEGRLTLKSRDVLAKYCGILAMTKRVKLKLAREGFHLLENTSAGTKKVNPLLTQYRYFVTVARFYETDLLLNPASAVRAPMPHVPRDIEAEDAELAAILRAPSGDAAGAVN